MHKFLAFSVMVLTCLSTAVSQSLDYPVTPIPFSKVIIQDSFWAPKIRINHEVTIPIAYSQSLKTGRIDNFKIAGGLMEGQFCTEYPFDDTDIYKIIEAASYSIQTFPDKEMEDMMDTLIQYISLAQEEDGYLYTTRTINKNIHHWAGEQRWTLVHELSHELYNLGHMFEAAVAHYTATGKRSFLDIAIKSANLICDVFGEDHVKNYPGHQEVEIGLVKLYRVAGDERYLNLARFFLDIRGAKGVGSPKKYDQSHIPVVQQGEAVGHAVRGAYMWTAMTDIAAIMHDRKYLDAITRIWHDIVDKKIYINGGIGATGSGEAFGSAYELPNMSAYCETCAGVGNAKWNHRMFLMTGDSKYIDVLERTMYNNILAGVSLSGDRFFYPNPLASFGQHERSAWFGCACCPPNVARFLPSMPGYIYAQKENDIYVNLYISSSTDFELEGGTIHIRQDTDFPWHGNTNIKISTTNETYANLKMRIPGYVKNRPVPSNLYTYLDSEIKPISIQLNGTPVEYFIDKKGYVTIGKKWHEEDQIKIDFPLEVHKVRAHPDVQEDIDKIAIEKGPILYCAEWADNPDGKVLNVIMDTAIPFETKFSDKLGDIYILESYANRASRRLDGTVDVSGLEKLTLIPYHLWNNRGPGEMNVWLPTSMNSTLPDPAPTIARLSKITSSSRQSRALTTLNDQLYPAHSNDHTIGYWHWWPNKGSQEWVQFDFNEINEVSEVKVYWFDDGPDGGCRIPVDWKVAFQEGGQWNSVEIKDASTIIKDAWNHIQFQPVNTSAIRLLIDLPENFASGLYEVVIE